MHIKALLANLHSQQQRTDVSQLISRLRCLILPLLRAGIGSPLRLAFQRFRHPIGSLFRAIICFAGVNIGLDERNVRSLLITTLGHQPPSVGVELPEPQIMQSIAKWKFRKQEPRHNETNSWGEWQCKNWGWHWNLSLNLSSSCLTPVPYGKVPICRASSSHSVFFLRICRVRSSPLWRGVCTLTSLAFGLALALALDFAAGTTLPSPLVWSTASAAWGVWGAADIDGVDVATLPAGRGTCCLMWAHNNSQSRIKQCCAGLCRLLEPHYLHQCQGA